MSGRDRTMALAGGIVVTVMILAVVLAVVVSQSSPGLMAETVPVLVGIAAPAAAALFAAAGVQRIAGNVDTIRRQTNGMLQREIDRADQVERDSRARAARVVAALDGAGVDLGDDGRRLRAELADELRERLAELPCQTRPIPTQQPTAGRHRNGGAQ